MESLCIEERNKLILTGAEKIIASTNTQAIVEVSDSNIIICGTDIEVTKLDLDNKIVTFAGKFSSVKYAVKTEKTSLLKRLFK